MNKPIVRNLIIIGIPTIISAIGIVMSLEQLKNLKKVFIYSTIFLLLIFIVFMIYYSWIDKKIADKRDEIKEENKQLKNDIERFKATITSMGKLLNTNNSIVTSLIAIVEPWTTNINKIANDIKAHGKANEKDWDYEKICTDICIGCKNTVEQFTQVEDNSNISVGFIRYFNEDDEEFVRMIAHSSPATAKPDIFDVQEHLKDCNYQYGRLLREHTRKILALENTEKIKQCFYKRHENTDLSKYTQYIAIPLFCSKNKVLGVLQITTEYGCVIMDTEVNLRKFAETYISPFVDLIILAEKIQKGLFMKPDC